FNISPTYLFNTIECLFFTTESKCLKRINGLFGIHIRHHCTIYEYVQSATVNQINRWFVTRWFDWDQCFPTHFRPFTHNQLYEVDESRFVEQCGQGQAYTT